MFALIHVGSVGVGLLGLALVAAVILLIGIVWYASRNRRSPSD